jgi:hypothetical protein
MSFELILLTSGTDITHSMYDVTAGTILLVSLVS